MSLPPRSRRRRLRPDLLEAGLQLHDAAEHVAVALVGDVVVEEQVRAERGLVVRADHVAGRRPGRRQADRVALVPGGDLRRFPGGDGGRRSELVRRHHPGAPELAAGGIDDQPVVDEPALRHQHGREVRARAVGRARLHDAIQPRRQQQGQQPLALQGVGAEADRVGLAVRHPDQLVHTAMRQVALVDDLDAQPAPPHGNHGRRAALNVHGDGHHLGRRPAAHPHEIGSRLHEDPGAGGAARDLLAAAEDQRLRLAVRPGHRGHQEGARSRRDRGRGGRRLRGRIRRQPAIDVGRSPRGARIVDLVPRDRDRCRDGDQQQTGAELHGLHGQPVRRRHRACRAGLCGPRGPMRRDRDAAALAPVVVAKVDTL